MKSGGVCCGADASPAGAIADRNTAGQRCPISRRGVMKILFIAFIVLFAIPAAAAELQVFAAASLSEALKEIGDSYQQESGTDVYFNFAASSLLARQISAGSPADVFFSADDEKMDDLQNQGLILNETRRTLLSNSLVIVISLDSNLTVKDPRDLAKSNWKIAVGEPKTVPAGIYARKYLEKIGLWSVVMDNVIPTENARAALATVEAGHVDIGIIYKTDAALSRKVKIGYEIPPEETPDIAYPVAVIREGKNMREAKVFVQYLSSQKCKAIFRKYGFLVR